MKLFLLTLLTLACGALWAGDVATAVKEAQLVAPYMWQIAAFFGVLGSLRVTQWIKKYQGFPQFMCNLKTSKDGKFQYYKLQKKYLIAAATILSFIAVSVCLNEIYELKQALILAGIVAISQFTIIELAFAFIDKKSPGASDILSHGLYVLEEEVTIYNKAVQLVVGGGTDKRPKKK